MAGWKIPCKRGFLAGKIINFYGGFSIAMSDYQRLKGNIWKDGVVEGKKNWEKGGTWLELKLTAPKMGMSQGQIEVGTNQHHDWEQPPQ